MSLTYKENTNVVLPQLTYEPTSQNQRVQGFEVPGDEQPRLFSRDTLLSEGELDALIQAAYRQIWNEQQILVSNRLPLLESQLRVGRITVRDFIRGLLLSANFQQRNYQTNNNYRFARMVVQRVLGRDVYSDREVMSWSIVLATQGLTGFVETLLNSEEYLSAFGENTVPYQRRRILPQRATGELPFARLPRYGADHLAQLEILGHRFHETGAVLEYRWAWQKQPPTWATRVGAVVTTAGAIALTAGVGAVMLSWVGLVHL